MVQGRPGVSSPGASYEQTPFPSLDLAYDLWLKRVERSWSERPGTESPGFPFVRPGHPLLFARRIEARNPGRPEETK